MSPATTVHRPLTKRMLRGWDRQRCRLVLRDIVLKSPDAIPQNQTAPRQRIITDGRTITTPSFGSGGSHAYPPVLTAYDFGGTVKCYTDEGERTGNIIRKSAALRVIDWCRQRRVVAVGHIVTAANDRAYLMISLERALVP